MSPEQFMSAPEELCELMEIPVSMCDHCRNPAGDRRTFAGAPVYGPVFTASYEGTCAECDGDIWVGEPIRGFQGQYAHEDCVDES